MAAALFIGLAGDPSNFHTFPFAFVSIIVFDIYFRLLFFDMIFLSDTHDSIGERSAYYSVLLRRCALCCYLGPFPVMIIILRL